VKASIALLASKAQHTTADNRQADDAGGSGIQAFGRRRRGAGR
jgi:hypothetical protein